ncbi:MAG: hypothetical protein QM785_01100 [Pyrinomonadaceae bacterium]
MQKEEFDINRLRVASPCSVSWESMTGDDRIRKCHSCELNIYNTAVMTKSEISNMISNRDGRLCIRLHRRSDGTVITQDCPIGLKKVRKRVSTIAASFFAMILGLVSVSYSQQSKPETDKYPKIEMIAGKFGDDGGRVTVYVYDQFGNVVPNAEVGFKLGKKEVFATTNYEGQIKRLQLTPNKYDIIAKAYPFKPQTIKNVEIKSEFETRLTILLEIRKRDIVTVGIFATDESRRPDKIFSLDRNFRKNGLIPHD